MKLKKIRVGGNREEIDKITKKHIPNLIESLQNTNLIFTPDKLMKKFFKDDDYEYNAWLIRHGLNPSQINYKNINRVNELLNILKDYTLKLLNEVKIDPMFSNELGNIMISRWIDSFDVLESHIYDLSDFNKIDFLKITDAFKKKFTTNSPFAFLIIDDVNQQLKIIESHKIILLLDNKLPMGNKRGTPPGQEAQRLYQNFFTSIGYKGKGELTEGFNYHRNSFKNFNFNLNIETRVLIDIIYETLNYNRENIQIAFIFGTYTKKLYFESDIKGTRRTKYEIEALNISNDIKRNIEKKFHKERQGSIGVDQTSIKVKKRIEQPKKDIISNIEQKEKSTFIFNNIKKYEEEILKIQLGYIELAKEKINEALTNRSKFIKEFYTFLDKGMSISTALNKFSERYTSNPYIKGIIETSITGEIQLQHLKDRGIEELNQTIEILENKIKNLKKDIIEKETKIASLNQNIETIIISHTKQLEKINIELENIINEKENLIKNNTYQENIISELKKLIIQYEKELKKTKKEIENYQLNLENKKEELYQSNILIKKLKEENKINKKSNNIIKRLKNNNEFLIQKIKNCNNENKYYIKQIKQLKEENELIISTIDLLKINNKQLEIQLKNLTEKNKSI